jgi:hypothetical protein
MLRINYLNKADSSDCWNELRVFVVRVGGYYVKFVWTVKADINASDNMRYCDLDYNEIEPSRATPQRLLSWGRCAS